MEDYHLERLAKSISTDVVDLVERLINEIETYEDMINSYKDKVIDLEGDIEALSYRLDETQEELKQSQIERLQLLELIKNFNNVDISR